MNTPTSTTMRPRFPWLVIAATLPALAILLGLGSWQVQRLAWKQDLLAQIDARLNSTPIDALQLAQELESAAKTQQELDYQPITVRGTFDHDAEVYFFATHKGVSGYYIYTPLMVSGSEKTVVFVNRGFVPFDLKPIETRPATRTSGVVGVNGLARQKLTEKPSWVVPDNEPEKNLYFWKDLATMADQAGFNEAVTVLPFFIDEGSPRTPGRMGDWPVSGVTLINLPNNHLQYAVTWYGLAAALLVVSGLFVRRRIRSG